MEIGRSRIDWLAGGATLLAIASCYGTAALVGALALLGVTLPIHEGAWAGIVIFFGVLAAAGVALGYRDHSIPGPPLLALAGAALIAWVMLADYNRIAELTGFAALAIAAIWNWRLKKKTEPQEEMNVG
jgi:arsenite methyltransferase